MHCEILFYFFKILKISVLLFLWRIRSKWQHSFAFRVWLWCLLNPTGTMEKFPSHEQSQRPNLYQSSQNPLLWTAARRIQKRVSRSLLVLILIDHNMAQCVFFFSAQCVFCCGAGESELCLWISTADHFLGAELFLLHRKWWSWSVEEVAQRSMGKVLLSCSKSSVISMISCPTSIHLSPHLVRNTAPATFSKMLVKKKNYLWCFNKFI